MLRGIDVDFTIARDGCRGLVSTPVTAAWLLMEVVQMADAGSALAADILDTVSLSSKGVFAKQHANSPNMLKVLTLWFALVV